MFVTRDSTRDSNFSDSTQHWIFRTK